MPSHPIEKFTRRDSDGFQAPPKFKVKNIASSVGATPPPLPPRPTVDDYIKSIYKKAPGWMGGGIHTSKEELENAIADAERSYSIPRKDIALLKLASGQTMMFRPTKGGAPGLNRPVGTDPTKSFYLPGLGGADPYGLDIGGWGYDKSIAQGAGGWRKNDLERGGYYMFDPRGAGEVGYVEGPPPPPPAPPPPPPAPPGSDITDLFNRILGGTAGDRTTVPPVGLDYPGIKDSIYNSILAKVNQESERRKREITGDFASRNLSGSGLEWEQLARSQDDRREDLAEAMRYATTQSAGLGLQKGELDVIRQREGRLGDEFGRTTALQLLREGRMGDEFGRNLDLQYTREGRLGKEFNLDLELRREQERRQGGEFRLGLGSDMYNSEQNRMLQIYELLSGGRESAQDRQLQAYMASLESALRQRGQDTSLFAALQNAGGGGSNLWGDFAGGLAGDAARMAMWKYFK